ncbi:Pr6Pr family membrane protein [Algoriphagus antarcticus]
MLTNTLVAIYFTCIAFIKNQESNSINKPGILTAITIYIFMVGIVYQVALRHVWQPQGLQMVVDELLHSIIPILVIIFWAKYEKTKSVNYSQLLKWAIYPITYLAYILIRGSFSNFYPYPFVDVTKLGMTAVLTNSVVLVLIFIVISSLFIFIGKAIIKR